jgi:hypothetical protein
LESLFFDGYDPYFEGDEPPVCRVDKTVHLVSNFGHWRNSGYSKVGYPFAPGKLVASSPLALTDSRRIAGKPRKSLVEKKEVPWVPFRGRMVPASQQASAEDRHGPLATQVFF